MNGKGRALKKASIFTQKNDVNNEWWMLDEERNV
jgi:hypothetical protein